MPSSVSAHRFSGCRVTSAPHGAWSNPPSRYGDRASSLAWPPGPVAAVVAERHRLDERHVQAQRTRRPSGRPGRPRARGSCGCADGRRGTRTPGSCRRDAGTTSRAGCGRGRVRSRCGTDRAPRRRHGCRRRAARVALVASSCGLGLLAGFAGANDRVADRRRRVGVGDDDVVGAVAGHRGRPPLGAFGRPSPGTGDRPWRNDTRCRRDRRR